ncbi:hypothetical protein AB0I69_28070 [Streptomyces sp. NPDC050508]|uniref:hypothetical protein n=1 Tax=Streptomyces sp. NPDC050508 TaxID=3155405 RepID=UPI00343C32D7
MKLKLAVLTGIAAAVMAFGAGAAAGSGHVAGSQGQYRLSAEDKGPTSVHE